MRFRRVDATSFGPLDGGRLDLAEGLNVIWGPNEAAKSSWHAAMYAALCGRRRGRGANQRDAQFEARHAPWSSEEWLVGAVVELDDGRTIRLTHDLAAKHSDVIDVQLGRSVADDIISDGAPDGARWVGLDRSTFLSTACVRQTELNAVLDDPAGIKQLLQQAASSLGGEVTAAEAIEQLKTFRRDAVGQDRANAVKPLRKAVEAVQQAEARLESVASAHLEHQRLVASMQSAGRNTASAIELLAAAQAVEEHRRAVQLRQAADEARALATTLEAAGRPEAVVDDRSLDELAGVVIRFDNAPMPAPLQGPSLVELDEQLAMLPSEPAGPTVESQQVVESVAAIERIDQILGTLDEPPEVVGADVETLQLAVDKAVLAQSPEPADEGLASALEAAKNAHEFRRRQKRRRDLLLGAGMVAAAAGVVAALAGAGAVAVALCSVGIATALTGLLGHRADDPGDVEELSNALAEHRQRVDDHRRDAEAAVDWLTARGLNGDPGALRRQAFARSAADAERSAYLDQRASLTGQRTEARHRLVQALVDEGIAVVDLDVALDRYRAAVASNRRAVEERQVLPALVEQRRERQAAEERHERELRACTDARRDLIDGAVRAGLVVDQNDRTIDFGALRERVSELIESGRAERERQVEVATISARLDHILGDRSLEELFAAAQSAAASASVPSIEIDVSVDQARHELAQAKQHEAELAGRLAVVDPLAVDVADAEAELAEARRELERVQALAAVLDTTTRHLQSAEAQAFRRVAPLVAAEVTAHLPAVTAGRYVEAFVDPDGLEVKVADVSGRLRSADLLSHGTREQIYLLLRLAMVKVLTAADESCPLLIDDATVHADATRTESLLSLLKDASGERQVVIFTQEAAVRDWAKEHLGERDQLTLLDIAA